MDLGQGIQVVFFAAQLSDVEVLVSLRVESMREGLENIGRFDPVRARQRFLSRFIPEGTHHIEVNGERVGFVVVKAQTQGMLLGHLYVHPRAQGKGIDRAVLAHVFAQADATGVPIRVGALRGSDSNHFYAWYGFQLVKQGRFGNSNVPRPKISDADNNAATFDVAPSQLCMATEREKGLGQRVRD